MDHNEIHARLVALIAGELTPLTPEELTLDLDLLDGLLDSLGIEELFEFIADQTGSDIRDEERVRSNISSLRAIMNFMAAR